MGVLLCSLAHLTLPIPLIANAALSSHTLWKRRGGCFAVFIGTFNTYTSNCQCCFFVTHAMEEERWVFCCVHWHTKQGGERKDGRYGGREATVDHQ